MTKFQTAQERETPIPHSYDPSTIVQLHADPEPSIEDLLVSYSANAEELLLLKEELEQELWEKLEEIAPTTTNLPKTQRWEKHLVQGTTLIRRRA